MTSVIERHVLSVGPIRIAHSRQIPMSCHRKTSLVMMQQQLDITHYSPSLLTILESDVAEQLDRRGVWIVRKKGTKTDSM